MRNTKNDLSFDSAQLDFDALEKTATYAVINEKNNIQEYLDKLSNDLIDKQNTGVWLNATYLIQTANRLSTACETYATIKEAKTRNNLEIINKPEVENN